FQPLFLFFPTINVSSLDQGTYGRKSRDPEGIKSVSRRPCDAVIGGFDSFTPNIRVDKIAGKLGFFSTVIRTPGEIS
ncbi:hypothetical protein, partial [Mobiluncus curtisii]|uniref:hypothetical protein n=1 Tax=Mobiluncus curtisii TaxID=2051 RepID=UPI0021E1D06A